jgi:hypothetical protein
VRRRDIIRERGVRPERANIRIATFCLLTRDSSVMCAAIAPGKPTVDGSLGGAPGGGSDAFLLTGMFLALEMKMLPTANSQQADIIPFPRTSFLYSGCRT